MNVQLITTISAARRVISRSFGRGWSSRSRTYAFRERVWKLRGDRSKESIIGLGKGLVRFFVPNKATRSSAVESGYVYFQEFIPGNDSDIRVIVIGGKAFAIRRLVRKGDFRASGSGLIDYRSDSIPLACVRIAFDASKKMRAQMAAFDFVLRGIDPLVVEVSYGFSSSAYLDCPGYWDADLEWHSAEIKPESLMMEDFINELDSMAK